MWDKLEHDFGHVKKGSVVSYEFNYVGSKTVKEVEPTCNCVGWKWFSPNNLRIRWNIKKGGRIGESLTRTILIVYDDDSLDELTLKAKING